MNTIDLRFGTGLYASSLELSGDSLDSLYDVGGVVGCLVELRPEGIDSFSVRISTAGKKNSLDYIEILFFILTRQIQSF